MEVPAGGPPHVKVPERLSFRDEVREYVGSTRCLQPIMSGRHAFGGAPGQARSNRRRTDLAAIMGPFFPGLQRTDGPCHWRNTLLLDCLEDQSSCYDNSEDRISAVLMDGSVVETCAR